MYEYGEKFYVLGQRGMVKPRLWQTPDQCDQLESTLVILKSKGPSETLGDIRFA